MYRNKWRLTTVPPDSVQIGSLVVSKPLFDVVVPLISGLVGTLTGGLITFLVSTATDNRKWRREKGYKLQEQRREAIGIALEWIAPLQQALTKASLVSSAYQFRRIDRAKFSKDYPYVISSLVELEPSAKLRALLPKDAYRMSFEIIHGLEELKHLSLEGLETFKACSDVVSALRAKVENLQSYLEEQYRATFS